MGDQQPKFALFPSGTSYMVWMERNCEQCSNQIETMTPEQQRSAIEETCDRLLADGWTECPNQFRKYARCFYKRFDTPTVCNCNKDKPGMQIELAVSDGFSGCVSMELELCGELRDETGLKIHNYSLPKSVDEVTALIPRLLSMWEAANNWRKE